MNRNMEVTRFTTFENNLVRLRDELVLVDKDVAELFGVETRDINKAVKNNPAKFPQGYAYEVTKDEFDILRGKFSTAKFAKTRVLPKAFTEKGLYMRKFEFNLGFAKVSRSVKKIKSGQGKS